MDRHTVRFEIIRTLGFTAPSTENKRSSLRPIIRNERMNKLNCGLIRLVSIII
jgi:hypothetical protein